MSLPLPLVLLLVLPLELLLRIGDRSGTTLLVFTLQFANNTIRVNVANNTIKYVLYNPPLMQSRYKRPITQCLLALHCNSPMIYIAIFIQLCNQCPYILNLDDPSLRQSEKIQLSHHQYPSQSDHQSILTVSVSQTVSVVLSPA